MLSENYKWNIINEFFKKKGFVSHQVDTFNDYINNGVQRVITESDIVVNLSPTQKYTVSFDNIYIPKPSIIEEDRTVRPMFPSEARQRDLTYDSPILLTLESKKSIVMEKILQEEKVFSSFENQIRKLKRKTSIY